MEIVQNEPSPLDAVAAAGLSSLFARSRRPGQIEAGYTPPDPIRRWRSRRAEYLMIEQAQAFAGTRSKFVETRQAIEQKSAKTSALIDVEASTTRAAYKGLHAANRYRSIQHPRSARVDCPL